ncbi:uncharacterized protein LOC100679461 [Nasonia vitripennis]|uniref:Uncharacterized protein n=1 Tax=Nasonia vitripennis TaxID=7425 RepID=A0A7M7QZ32_NASVI|nr:uncharacterized protein LOC100679461 [Nasonia vitripennis]
MLLIYKMQMYHAEMEYSQLSLEKNAEPMLLTDKFQTNKSGYRLPNLDQSAMISLMAHGYTSMMDNHYTNC